MKQLCFSSGAECGRSTEFFNSNINHQCESIFRIFGEAYFQTCLCLKKQFGSQRLCKLLINEDLIFITKEQYVMIRVFYNVLGQNCRPPPPTQHQPQYWRENMAGQENEKLTKQPLT